MKPNRTLRSGALLLMSCVALWCADTSKIGKSSSQSAKDKRSEQQARKESKKEEEAKRKEDKSASSRSPATPDTSPAGAGAFSWRQYAASMIRTIETQRNAIAEQKRAVSTLLTQVSQLNTALDPKGLISALQRTRARLMDEKARLAAEAAQGTALQQFRLRSTIEAIDRDGGPLAGLVLDLEASASKTNSAESAKREWIRALEGVNKQLDTVLRSQDEALVLWRDFERAEAKIEDQQREDRRKQEEQLRQTSKSSPPPVSPEGQPVSDGTWECGGASGFRCEPSAGNARLELRTANGKLKGTYQIASGSGKPEKFDLTEPERSGSGGVRFVAKGRNRAEFVTVDATGDQVEVQFLSSGSPTGVRRVLRRTDATPVTTSDSARSACDSAGSWILASDDPARMSFQLDISTAGSNWAGTLTWKTGAASKAQAWVHGDCRRDTVFLTLSDGTKTALRLKYDGNAWKVENVNRGPQDRSEYPSTNSRFERLLPGTGTVR